MPRFTLEAEYSKSARAACKQCKAKIDKDIVRVGIKAAAPEGDEGAGGQSAHMLEAVRWHHSSCLPKARGHAWFKKHFSGEEPGNIKGLEQLKEEDREMVLSLVKHCQGLGPMPDMPSAAGAQEADATPVKSASGKRKGKAAAGEAEEQPPAKASKTTTGLSADQLAAIDAIKIGLASKNLAALSAMLAKNGLPKTGKKDELLERVAENKALGVPPTCAMCQKVKLKFARESGKYSCPGFFDDESKAFKRCKGPGEGADLQRTPWQELV